MAARTLRPRHSDEVRAKIQASQLINRLSDHVDGKIELSQTQVRAAEILLKKSIPDLSAVEMTGKDGKDLFASETDESLSLRIAKLMASKGAEK
jgi:hypothetical protein